MVAIDIKRDNVAEYALREFIHNQRACVRAKHNMCTAQHHQRALAACRCLRESAALQLRRTGEMRLRHRAQ